MFRRLERFRARRTASAVPRVYPNLVQRPKMTCDSERLFKRLLLLAALLLAPPLLALESDRRQPIDIRARQVVVDEQRGYSEYTGDVTLTQGSLHVTGDRLVVHLDGDRLKRIIVEGQPATLVQIPAPEQPPVHASARRMEYEVASRTVLLDRDAQVEQGPNRFRGDHLVYDIAAATVKARSGEGRVHITIQPPADETESAP